MSNGYIFKKVLAEVNNHLAHKLRNQARYRVKYIIMHLFDICSDALHDFKELLYSTVSLG